jgi:hypothetical protein
MSTFCFLKIFLMANIALKSELQPYYGECKQPETLST